MRTGKIVVGIFLTFLAFSSLAQAVSNTASFRMFPAEKYFRINYDNDYFTATDYYYTQGINLEVVNPAYDKFFLSKLLYVEKGGNRQYGIALEHNGYTPITISSSEIQYGDRPFAAAVMLRLFVMNDHSEHRYRITSALTMGVIGPAAGGGDMQKEIHKWIHATIPQGWQHQISNDVVLNYEVGYEKNLLYARDRLVLNGTGSVRVGTLNTKASAGVVIMFGRLNSKIESVFGGAGIPLTPTKRLRFHAYAQPMVHIVGYDATLQGGLFNSSSPYTLSSADVSRVTAEISYGVVATFNAMYLEYYKSAITKEWDTGTTHQWGGIRIGVRL